MKKKIFSLLAIFVLIINVTILTSCNEDDNKSDFSIVTTLFPQYDFAKQITGDTANVSLLLTPGSESHSYEPTPKDISKIQQSDIFIYIGGESEIWVDNILDSINNKSMKVIRLMDYVDLKNEDAHEENDEAHESEEHNHYSGFDEHIFTSLKNSEVLLKKIKETVIEVKPENKDLYENNAQKYCNKIIDLDESFSKMINSSKRNTVVFGDRYPFKYFAEDYGLECFAAFSGCSSETEANPSTVSMLINKVKEENVPIIFHIEFSNSNIADKIADATGTKTSLLHSCHNISKEDLKNNVTYVDLMKQNYEQLKAALN